MMSESKFRADGGVEHWVTERTEPFPIWRLVETVYPQDRPKA